MLHIDFETRGVVDLPKEGIYRYATNKYTEVVCMAWAFDDGEVQIWHPGMKISNTILDYLKDGGLVAAHNAQFERLIWNNVFYKISQKLPSLPISRWYCSAALCRARGYPGGLDKAMRFSRLPFQKDYKGYQLMMKMCRPLDIEKYGIPVWYGTPQDFKDLYEYCKMDVVCERELLRTLLPFSDEELADYHLSEEINDTGVKIDSELARIAVTSVAKEGLALNETLETLTGGEVTKFSQVARILDWVEEKWIRLPDLGKATVDYALDREDIPDNVRLALEIRQNGASAAVGKFASMLDRIGLDDVLRGMFLFRGAGPGRFSSVGTQIHNLLRQSYPQYIPLLKKHGLKGLELIGDPIKLLAGMVRPAFIPEKGKVFLVGDYVAIEARVLAWVSGAMTPLRAFRNNEDVYCTFGTKAYGRTITKEHDPDERFISKMVVLSLGYQGGEGALDRVLRKDNVFLSQKERQYLVDFYRNEFAPEVKNFWKAVSAASFKAIYTPGSIVDVGAVQFLYDGTHMWLRLPSERLICYPFAEIGQNDYGDVVRYQRGNRSPKKGESDWPMVDLYGGLLTENICQGIALDILVAALHNVNADKRFLTRIHVHDEIVAEVQKGLEKELLLDFKDLMEATPEWARNIPIVSEVESFDRYVKG